MNRILPVLTIFFLITLNGFSQAVLKRTHEELKIAYANELTASAKYARYAEAARSENFPVIAKLFQATSKSESIHAANHKKVLEFLKVDFTNPGIGSFEVKKTTENLAEAIKGETYEFETMYPAYLKTAESENESEAMLSYRYAMETEKRHATLYKFALEALKTNNTASISTGWFVCPTCGNIYDLVDVKISCEFCGTLKPRFIVF